jgi:hypothetical protein
VDEPQAQCAECQASGKDNMTTDADLQRRVEELEALIRQARRNNTIRTLQHDRATAARNAMQIHAHGPIFPAIDIEIEDATDGSSEHDDDPEDLLSIDDSEYADDEDDGDYEEGHVPMDVVGDNIGRLPIFQVPEARPFRPTIETLPIPEELLSHLFVIISVSLLHKNELTRPHLPSIDKKNSIDVFCSYSFAFNFFKPIGLFLKQLSLPHTHPDSPHPCLLNSIYLLACHFSPRSNVCLAPFIEIFMQRTLRLVNEQPQSPTATDRPLDICMALILYARFCFYTNRLDTGVCFTNCKSLYTHFLLPVFILLWKF